MREVKDTKRATVRIGYDGKVYKQYRGPHAEKRFGNEVMILRYLEERECPFVPRLLEVDEDHLSIVTTNCGMISQGLRDEKVKRLFAELEAFGVQHEDPFDRNITYSAQLGRFCIIDFEFAVILETGEGLRLEDTAK